MAAPLTEREAWLVVVLAVLLGVHASNFASLIRSFLS